MRTRTPNAIRSPTTVARQRTERFSVLSGLRSVVVPIFDTAPTDAFAQVTLKTIAVATGLDLTPADSLIACSAPASLTGRAYWPMSDSRSTRLRPRSETTG